MMMMMMMICRVVNAESVDLQHKYFRILVGGNGHLFYEKVYVNSDYGINNTGTVRQRNFHQCQQLRNRRLKSQSLAD